MAAADLAGRRRASIRVESAPPWRSAGMGIKLASMDVVNRIAGGTFARDCRVDMFALLGHIAKNPGRRAAGSGRAPTACRRGNPMPRRCRRLRLARRSLVVVPFFILAFALQSLGSTAKRLALEPVVHKLNPDALAMASALRDRFPTALALVDLRVAEILPMLDWGGQAHRLQGVVLGASLFCRRRGARSRPPAGSGRSRRGLVSG